MALRRAWYSNPTILYNIIECLKYRETVFIAKDKGVIRCVKANAVKFLQMNFKRYHFLEQEFNLYGSLGHFPNLPMFSFNRVEKRKEQDVFNTEYQNYLSGYSFLLDVDAEDKQIGTALTSLRAILKHFQGISYYIILSGQKGFHIKVDYEDMPDEFKQMSIPDLCNMFKKFAENFSLINNLPDVDLKVYDTRRIAKCPYSVTYPFYFIALPMDDNMVENFDLKEYSIKTQLNNIHNLRNRGLLKREGNPDKFRDLIRKYAKI